MAQERATSAETREDDLFSPWRRDTYALDTLELIATALTRVAGFEVAVISVVIGAEEEAVTVVGNDEAREALLFHRTPLSAITRQLDRAEHWGAFRFVSHHDIDIAGDEEHFWVPDAADDGDAGNADDGDHDGAWHPLDMILAPLHHDDGRLVGVLWLDVPVDRRLPSPAVRSDMDRFADQARHALLATLERAELTERLRLADAARDAVRRAGRLTRPADLLADVREQVAQGFGAQGLWLQVFDGDQPGSVVAVRDDGSEQVLPEPLLGLAHVAARRAWAAQEAPIVDLREPLEGPYLGPVEAAAVEAFLESIGITSLLFVPIGAGDECLGNLVLTRTADAPAWNRVEVDAALEIGHDLGRVLLNARALDRERTLVEELRERDRSKSRLIATVAHELRSPLAAILGHVELLSDEDLAPRTRTSIDTIDRSARRLQRTVEDLLDLARFAGPTTGRDPVDLREVVGEVRELTALAASHRDHVVRLSLPDRPVVVLGDAHELERAVTNLVSNAVKYSEDGGVVTLGVTISGAEAVLSVGDQGLGISEEDLEGLFSEFFRGTNSAALRQPGTGLGLTIVAQIAARHGGRVEVASKLGEGSTFTLLLPLAGRSHPDQAR